MTGPVYALNLFDVSNKDEYLAHLFDKLTDLRLILNEPVRIDRTERCDDMTEIEQLGPLGHEIQ